MAKGKSYKNQKTPKWNRGGPLRSSDGGGGWTENWELRRRKYMTRQKRGDLRRRVALERRSGIK